MNVCPKCGGSFDFNPYNPRYTGDRACSCLPEPLYTEQQRDEFAKGVVDWIFERYLSASTSDLIEQYKKTLETTEEQPNLYQYLKNKGYE